MASSASSIGNVASTTKRLWMLAMDIDAASFLTRARRALSCRSASTPVGTLRDSACTSTPEWSNIEQTRLHVDAGHSLVVPQGCWHRLEVVQPGQLLFDDTL